MSLLPLNSREGIRRYSASVARTYLPPEKMLRLIHSAGPSSTKLWWGPVVPLRDGDIVEYFKTATGEIAVESVRDSKGRSTSPDVV